MSATWPAEIREPLIEYHLKILSKTMTEGKNLNNKICEEIRKEGKLSNSPLIVYTTLGIDPFMTPITSKSFLRDILEPFNNIKNTVYIKLAYSVPREEHRILRNAEHTTIHTDCLDEVAKAISNLIDLVNTHGQYTFE